MKTEKSSEDLQIISESIDKLVASAQLSIAYVLIGEGTSVQRIACACPALFMSGALVQLLHQFNTSAASEGKDVPEPSPFEKLFH